MLAGPRGATERIRTSTVDLRRIASHPWNGGKYRCVATPAAVAVAAPSLPPRGASRASEVGTDRKRRRVERTTSSIPASFGSAALNPFDVFRPRPAWPEFPVRLGCPAEPAQEARRLRRSGAGADP